MIHMAKSHENDFFYNSSQAPKITNENSYLIMWNVYVFTRFMFQSLIYFISYQELPFSVNKTQKYIFNSKYRRLYEYKYTIFP